MVTSFNFRSMSSSQKLSYDIADAMATSIPASTPAASAQTVPATAMAVSSVDLFGSQVEDTLAPSLMDSYQSFSQPDDTPAKALVDSSLFLASSKMSIGWQLIEPHDYMETSSIQTQSMVKAQSNIQDCRLVLLSPPSPYDGPSRTQFSVDSIESQLRELVFHAGDDDILHGVNYHIR